MEMSDLYSLYRMVTLEIMSWSLKSNHLFSTSQHCIYASLVKIHPLAQKTTHRNPIWTFQSAGVTLKIRSRLVKLNLLFPFFQQCIYSGLVKGHLLDQKITQGNPIFAISKCMFNLEIYVKVTEMFCSLSFS